MHGCPVRGVGANGPCTALAVPMPCVRRARMPRARRAWMPRAQRARMPCAQRARMLRARHASIPRARSLHRYPVRGVGTDAPCAAFTDALCVEFALMPRARRARMPRARSWHGCPVRRVCTDALRRWNEPFSKENAVFDVSQTLKPTPTKFPHPIPISATR